MGRSKKSKTVATVAAVAGTVIATIADLAKALATVTHDASAALGTVAWGSMFRLTSGSHFNKRGAFVASIVDCVTGDGTFDTLKAGYRKYAVPAMRAELTYAVTSGDAGYFRSAKTNAWCAWALPLLKDNALDPNATDDALFVAYEKTCPTNPANVNGMLTEITLAAQRRNVTPLPVFADAVATGKVALYDADTHKAYAAKGYGHATFTLPA